MKTKLLFIALSALVFGSCSAQNQATVYAKNSDISDNLDLRAVASMFGESANLQDFERRLNDPKYQISNLDLNGDNEVDYLRVIESVEERTHVVIIRRF
jgi:cystathionine beta-lyase family protein involved in aluminum resistance